MKKNAYQGMFEARFWDLSAIRIRQRPER